MYPTLKLIHVACVVISVTGFTLRAILALRDSPRLQQRWIRVLPHLNDTLLLGSALAMVFLSAQYPFVAGWLTAKVLGLLAYIGLGVVVMRSRHPGIRRWAFILALMVIGWVASVALARHPAGVFILLAN